MVYLGERLETARAYRANIGDVRLSYSHKNRDEANRSRQRRYCGGVSVDCASGQHVIVERHSDTYRGHMAVPGDHVR